MATNNNNRAKTSHNLADSVREHAEASVKDVQDVAAATADHTGDVVTAISRSAVDSAQRGSEIADEAWKSWTATVFRPSGNAVFSSFDIGEVVNASFNMAGGVLDTQRQLAQRLVGATATAPAGQ